MKRPIRQGFGDPKWIPKSTAPFCNGTGEEPANVVVRFGCSSAHLEDPYPQEGPEDVYKYLTAESTWRSQMHLQLRCSHFVVLRFRGGESLGLRRVRHKRRESSRWSTGLSRFGRKRRPGVDDCQYCRRIGNALSAARRVGKRKRSLQPRAAQTVRDKAGILYATGRHLRSI